MDRALISALTTGAPLSGGTVADLLAALGSPSRPVVIGGYDVVFGLPAGTLRDLVAMTVPVLASPAASGMLATVDASGLLISAGESIVVDAHQ